MDDIKIKEYNAADVFAMNGIWNEVVEEGVAFPQEDFLDEKSGAEFFASQSYCGVAECGEKVLGLYILHPNNIGRCGHICNASYAVASGARGMHLGRALVLDCIKQAKRLGFKVLQFNAVVDSNIRARRLYESLGFVALGRIPGGFRLKNGEFGDIWVYYYNL